EAARNAHARVESLKDRKDLFDAVPDSIVVFDQVFPGDLRAWTEDSPRHVRHDPGLAAQMRARRNCMAVRGMHHAHGIFDGDELRCAVRADFFTPRDARQYVGTLTVNDVTTIELRRDLH